MRRAQAEALGGVIVIGIVMLILIPLILSVFLDTQRSMERHKAIASFQAERLAEKLVVDWLPTIDPRYPAFWVNNTGTVAVEVKTLFLIDTASHRILYAINLTEYQPAAGKPVTRILLYPGGVNFAGGRLTLKPGESSLFILDENREELRRITVSTVLLSARGVLHPAGGLGLDRRLASIAGGRALTAVMLEPRIVILNFTRLSDILSPDSPIELATGNYLSRTAPIAGVVVYDSSRGNYVYTVVSECTSNCPVNIQDREFHTAVIGYTPGSRDKFNMLLSYRDSGGGATVWYRVKIEGLTLTQFSFQYTSSDRYFNVNTNNASEAIGYWFYANTAGSLTQPGSSVSITGRITVVGTADRVTVYRLGSGTGLNSYEPFLLVADTDGNGYGEVILITEDYKWGCVNPPQAQCFADEGGAILAYSAYISGGRVTHNPWNPLGGFTFRLREVVLDPKKVISVYVMARVFYHDTEIGGLGECIITPYPIMRFLLVDENWNVLAFKDVTYNELVAAASENTWPPARQYVIISATLAVPVTDARRVYIAVSLLDPFGSVNRDDLDLTIGIEIIGVIPYVRGG